MKKKLHLFKIKIFVVCLLAANLGFSQCPTTASISANAKCIFLTWNTPPNTFPTSVTYNSVVYTDQSLGTGAVGDPKIYRDDTPGGGGCNANQSVILTGVIYIPGACTYLNGNLPLLLLSFEGQNVNNINYLKWSTSSEQNTDVFEVESSLNGQKFEKIGTVKSKNNNSKETNNYSFSDETISENPIYYRLKIIDMDGAVNNSKIIAIKGSEKLSYANAFPSPTAGMVNINVHNDSNIGTTAKVLDLTGKQIMAFAVSKKISPLDLSNLNKGLYIVRFNNGEFVKIIKE